MTRTTTANTTMTANHPRRGQSQAERTRERVRAAWAVVAKSGGPVTYEAVARVSGLYRSTVRDHAAILGLEPHRTPEQEARIARFRALPCRGGRPRS